MGTSSLGGFKIGNFGGDFGAPKFLADSVPPGSILVRVASATSSCRLPGLWPDVPFVDLVARSEQTAEISAEMLWAKSSSGGCFLGFRHSFRCRNSDPPQGPSQTHQTRFCSEPPQF